MLPKLYIRADGNSQIGLGHLIRCFALANMVKENFDVTFVCKDIPVQTQTEFEKLFSVKKINSEKDFLDSLETNDTVLLDGYNFDTNYQNEIKNNTCGLVCIDDLHDKKFVSDLIINHAPGIKAENYNAALYTQFALGTEYALLRPEFIQQAAVEIKIDKIEKVFICFGGADANSLTDKVLKQVLKFSEFKKIIIVTGAGYLFKDELESFIKSDSRIEHYHSIDSKKMCELMSGSDLAIVPSSGILLEALACGCKVISGMTADNQKYVYSNYLQTNAFLDAGKFEDENVLREINEAIKNPSSNNKIVDGKSKERLSKLFNQLVLKSSVILTKAGTNDLETTFEWAANPVVRAFSFSQHTITLDEHSNWFTKKIKDDNCLYLIAEMNGEKIGSIRFDIDNNTAIISYLIAPKYHGKGLGLIILTNGLSYLQKEIEKNSLPVKNVIGYVMEENIPSVKAFERLGFKKTIEEDKIKYEKEVL
jgi:UDP-2,4-diacetamido-2,4,6-trideoxy-beta-L-altropyranose hydrolase